ncbi:response regulator transcription factor [Paenibacillus filicis]|uniref:Response regulator transcription factor n=1 Tax=Paenibacillus filicis TaxID=669464 RepID=A0ABU9DI39_9BACL
MLLKEEKILLVDDEEGILTLLEITLKKERYQFITTCTTGQEALSLVKNQVYDVILLDIMLPDINGLELCKQIRSLTHAPIIFVTACSSDFDKLTGFGIGGDDYITKPFNPLEVVARIHSLLRRQHLLRSLPAEKIEKKELRFGPIALLPDDAILVVGEHRLECTAKELDLLLFFFRNPNRIFTSSQIYELVWKEPPQYGDEKTVAMHISKIRKKLESNPKSPEVIINLKGIGYKFVPPVQGELR